MAQISTVSATEVLAGLVDRVTFHNSDNGWAVGYELVTECGEVAV